ncbi:MAG: hypothetical protein S4CHLAM2_01110 [Chlamydiales bacterium]|nr:hypothetical protein [Chlamydiales bacterium]
MNLLSQMIASGQVPHALFFTGPKGAQLDEAVKQFAVDLVGKYPHPDVHDYFPEGKSDLHPIANLRKLTEDVGFVPYEAQKKLYIVHEAEKMLPTSSNALLKTFEEPTAKTVIVLLSHHPEKMLSTILSRCRVVNFPAETIQVKHKIIDVLAGNASLKSVEEGEQDHDELLETVLLWFRDRMLLEIEGGESFLSYPDYRTSLKKAPLIPLEHVEKVLAQARLGLERSVKLSTCLEALFYSI